MILTVKTNNHTFVFSKWMKFRTKHDFKNSYPDYIRLSDDFPYWDVEIGFKLISSEIEWQHNQSTGIWEAFSTPEFYHVIKIYKNLYGSKVSYDDIEAAKSKMDELLIKYDKLGCFL